MLNCFNFIKPLKSKNNLIELLKLFLLALLVIIGTFPENTWDFGKGIDSSLIWVFNHFADNGLRLGQNIIFPHLPLAFFMYPLPENIIIATIVISLLKALLVCNIYAVLKNDGTHRWLITFLISYFICIITGINLLIIANLILFYCNYFNTENNFYKYTAFLLTAFAFFIKSYVGIIAMLIVFSFLMYYFVKTWNWKKLLIDISIGITLLILFWLFMYGNFNGFFTYFLGLFNLGQDNSSAASLYPDNNWLYLSISILSIFLILIILPLINKDKKAIFFGIISILGLFAAWKHGMAREDGTHIREIFYYIIIVLLLFNLFVSAKFFRNFLLSIVAVFSFSINIHNTVNINTYKLEFFKTHYFEEFMTNFREKKAYSKNLSKTDIKKNILPKEIIEQIGSSSVDVYPWDYSYIPANNLNWQPRIVIQSYAAYTSWLDKKNATHFSSENAPEFIIWHFVSASFSYNKEQFCSIDRRYLLNDEPQTIIELLNNYERIYYDDNFMLLKKRSKKLKLEAENTAKKEITWNEWIHIPNENNSIMMAKLNFDKTLLQSLKSFVYKDEEFFIKMKLDNGSIFKYKFVPKNAVDGLWINPLVYSVETSFKIEQIMFVCSNEKIISKNLTLNFEKIIIDEDFNWFNSDYKSPIVSTTNDFEQDSLMFWHSNIENIIIDENSYSAKRNQIVKPKSSSSTFEFQLDSLIDGKNFIVLTDCMIKMFEKYNDKKGRVSLIIAVHNKDNSCSFLEHTFIYKNLLYLNKWNNINRAIEFSKGNDFQTLKVYIWNNSNKDIYIDDFTVNVYEN